MASPCGEVGESSRETSKGQRRGGRARKVSLMPPNKSSRGFWECEFCLGGLLVSVERGIFLILSRSLDPPAGLIWSVLPQQEGDMNMYVHYWPFSFSFLSQRESWRRLSLKIIKRLNPMFVRDKIIRKRYWTIWVKRRFLTQKQQRE